MNEYIVIQDWMIEKHKLKGIQLIVYAVIYGFSQDGESKFTGSSKYLMKWAGCSRTAVINALKELADKGLIIKDDRLFNNMNFPVYSANVGGCIESVQGVQKVDRGCTESVQGCTESLHNNIEYNIYNNIEYNKELLCTESLQGVQKVDTSKKNIPPTIEELTAYFKEKSDIGTGGAAAIEAEKFYHFYESKGWKVGKVKMTNWKSAVSGWIARNKKNNPNQVKKNYKYGTNESW